MTPPPGGEPPATPPARVSPAIDRLGAYSWRLIGIGIVGSAVIFLLVRLRLVLLALVVAVFLTVVLSFPATWLRRHGWRPLPATGVVFLAFFALQAGVVMIVAPAIGDEFGRLGPTVEEATEDLKEWIVRSSPFEVDQQRLDELQRQAIESARRAFRTSGGAIVRGAVLALEVIGALLLALVLSFFFVKDGHRFQAWALRQLPPERHDLTRRLANSTWRTLGGYLRGSAILGVFEAIIIGLTLALAGAGLVVPVMVVTFLAAFVPFVGAIVAGLIAVAVALVTAGPVPALVVGGVALAVQQLDNDILAPFVFGKALQVHPAVILVVIAAGGTLAGLGGAFLAVPVTAVIFNGVREARSPGAGEGIKDGDEEGEEGDDGAAGDPSAPAAADPAAAADRRRGDPAPDAA